MSKTFGCKSLDGDLDGLNVWNAVPVESGSTSGKVTDDLKTL